MDALLITVITLALFDSLNPSTIATQIFLLLSLEKPISRVISFIIGTFVIYFAFGFAVIFILGEPIGSLFFEMGSNEYFILLSMGIILIAVCILYWQKYSNKGDGRSKFDEYMQRILKRFTRLSPAHTFFFGMLSTAFDLPTAAFYFVAIASMIQVGITSLEMTSFLFLYNLIYILPLIIIVIIYLIARKRSEQLLHKANTLIIKWSAKLILPFIFLIGILLVMISLAFLLGSPIV